MNDDSSALVQELSGQLNPAIEEAQQARYLILIAMLEVFEEHKP